MIDNFFCLEVIEAAWILQILLYSPSKSYIFTEKKKKTPFVPWVSFFLLVVFAIDARGGVVGLEESFLIHKCLSAQQEKPCVSKTLLLQSCSEPATKQGQTLQIKEASILTHTHRQHHRIVRAIVPALQKFKSTCCYSISVFPSFLMEKEEKKMKSIFNVYRGARLKSLQSAETILHKLIFNEKAFCVRVKQSAMLVLVKEKQTWSPLKRLKGCGTPSLWAGVPAFTFKAAQCCVHC